MPEHTLVAGVETSKMAKLAAWLLFAAVALAPLPFGSFDNSYVALWCLVLGVCLVLAPLRPMSAGQMVLFALGALIIAAYALVLHEQLSDYPWLPISRPDPIWSDTSKALGTSLPGVPSITRDLPWYELGRPLVFILAIACGLVVCSDRLRARQLLQVFAWSGAVYAACGIIGHLIDPGHLLWREKLAYREWVTGTFVNHNTAATYFGSCVILWSLLVWEWVSNRLPDKHVEWQQVMSRLFSDTPTKIIVAFVMVFLCLAAMFMTGSRAGVVFSLVALVTAFIVFFRRVLPRRTGLVTMFIGAALTALLMLQVIGGSVSARIELEGVGDPGRLKAYAATLRMIADHPWLGTGQGTFADAFPAYRSSDMSMWGVWDIAHNSLLEIAADMGIPIAVLVVGAWILIFFVLIRGIRVRRRDHIVLVAAISVAMLGVLHSLVDFSLQIPGFAIPALALIGAGLAQSFVGTGGMDGGARAGKLSDRPMAEGPRDLKTVASLSKT